MGFVVLFGVIISLVFVVSFVAAEPTLIACSTTQECLDHPELQEFLRGPCHDVWCKAYFCEKKFLDEPKKVSCACGSCDENGDCENAKRLENKCSSDEPLDPYDGGAFSEECLWRRCSGVGTCGVRLGKKRPCTTPLNPLPSGDDANCYSLECEAGVCRGVQQPAGTRCEAFDPTTWSVGCKECDEQAKCVSESSIEDWCGLCHQCRLDINLKLRCMRDECINDTDCSDFVETPCCNEEEQIAKIKEIMNDKSCSLRDPNCSNIPHCVCGYGDDGKCTKDDDKEGTSGNNLPMDAVPI